MIVSSGVSTILSVDREVFIFFLDFLYCLVDAQNAYIEWKFL